MKFLDYPEPRLAFLIEAHVQEGGVIFPETRHGQPFPAKLLYALFHCRLCMHSLGPQAWKLKMIVRAC